MTRAQLEMNTENIVVNGDVCCAYCGRKIKPDTEIDHHEVTEYYHCDCEDAKKEIYVRQERKKIMDEYRRNIEWLDSQYPKPKFKAEKRDILIKI